MGLTDSFLRLFGRLVRGASIHRYLAILVAIAQIPLIAGLVVVLNFYSRQEMVRQRADAMSATRRLADLVERELDGYVAALQGLSTSEALKAEDWANFDVQARVVARLRGSAVSLRTLDGQQLVNTLVPAGMPLPKTSDPVLRRADAIAIDTGKPVTSDLYIGAVSRRLFVLVVMPVAIGTGKALLNIAVEPERLAEVIGRGLPPGHAASIIDRNNRFVARYPSHDRYVGLETRNQVTELRRVSEDVWLNRRADGVDVLGAHTTLKWGWQVLMSIPLNELRQPARSAFLSLTGLTILGVALSMALAWSLSAKLGREIGSLLLPQRTSVTGFDVRELRDVGAQLDAFDRSRDEAERNRAHLAAIVSTSRDAIFTIDLDGRIETWNAGAVQLFGYGEDVVGSDARRLMAEDALGDFERLLADGRVGRPMRADTVHRCMSGEVINVSVSWTPIAGAGGETAWISIVASDITDRKRYERQRDLMLRELDHRLKNVFATVSALMGLSARAASDVESYAASLRGRVYALSAAHDLVRGAGVSNTIGLADIMGVIAGTGTGSHTHFTAEGPPVLLSASEAIAFGMVLNELMTNAIKYGALSRPEGTVHCRWKLDGNSLDFLWCEAGGPEVSAPERVGFGSMMIQQSVEQLSGHVESSWAKEGLAVRIVVPLSTAAGATAART